MPGDTPPLCERCLKPARDEIHGPVETCRENGRGGCNEPKAHHAFQPARTAPAPLAFDAALAALDVEHYVTDKGWRSNILGLDAVRAAHRAEVERAVAEERDRNLDVLADFYSKTRAGRYASLSKEARQARLDVLTHAYSRMGGGLIHERADELDRDEPIDGEAIRARGAKS